MASGQAESQTWAWPIPKHAANHCTLHCSVVVAFSMLYPCDPCLHKESKTHFMIFKINADIPLCLFVSLNINMSSYPQ